MYLADRAPACHTHIRHRIQDPVLGPMSSPGGRTTPFRGTLAGGRGARRSTQPSVAMARAVTSPNYFPAPGFISDPSINSDPCIYPHLSQIRHRDTEDANVEDLAPKDPCHVQDLAQRGGRTPAIWGFGTRKKSPPAKPRPTSSEPPSPHTRQRTGR